MRKRSNFGGIFVFIGVLAIFGIVDFISLLLPLLALAVGGFLIFKLIKSLKSNTASKTTTINSGKSGSYNYSHVYQNPVKSKPLRVFSNAELNKIDKKLTNYFKNNMTLPIVEGISLCSQSGKFTTVNELCLTYQDEKIIKLGEFKKRYAEVYNKLMELLLVFADQKEEVLKEEVDLNPVKENVLSDANKYIEKIDKLNSEIPQEEITNGLYQTCALLKQIDFLKSSKNDEAKLRKLYDYYLPILINVLRNYKKLQDAPTHDEEFKKCEAQLIKTIVLINEALKTICANMQEEDYMNINADISTLQSLLKKDGYGSEPFNGDKK